MSNRLLILSVMTGVLATLGSSANLPLQRRGGSPSPSLTFDPNTDPKCSWWWDADNGLPCEVVVQWSGLTMADFDKWNPSVNSCEDWKYGHLYCVDVVIAAPEPPQSTTFTPPTPTTTVALFTGVISGDNRAVMCRN